MLTDVRQLRLPRLVWGGFAFVSIGLGAITALLLGASGQVSFSGAPRLELPLPPAGAAQIRAGADADMGAVAGAPVSPALIEPETSGPLPRVVAEGRRPLLAHAPSFAGDDARPKITLLIAGLGLQAAPTQAALRLPAAIGLQFSAYASDLAGQLGRARQEGHEVLLDLPMEPPDYPASDPGPRALLAGNPVEENLARLDWLLARAPGSIAVAGAGMRLATSASAAPVLDALARRGLALVEIGGRHLADGAAAVGLRYVDAPAVIDEDPSILSIDYALARLEAEARASGSALGVAQGYPVSLERLRLWATTLDDKGLVLAPVSAFVIARSGLAAESGERDALARSARG